MNESNHDNVTEYSLEDCLDENFDKTILDCSNCYNLSETSQWILVLHAMLIAIIIMSSLVSNGLILFMVIRYKKLRQHAVIVSLNIITADVLLVFSFHVPSFISVVSGGWQFNFWGCKVFGFLNIAFVIIRWIMMGILAIDRFCTVRFPFSYKKHKKVLLICLISAAWIIPIALSTATVFSGLISASFRQNLPTCQFYAPTIDRGLLYSCLILTVSFLFGAVLPAILYSWLYNRARKFRPSATKLGHLSVNVAGSVISLHLGQQPENNNSHEYRALVTFGLIFIGLFMTCAPVYLFQFMRWISTPVWCEIPIVVHFIAIDIFNFSTTLDPILIMRDRDFRTHLKYLFYGWCRCAVKSSAAVADKEVTNTAQPAQYVAQITEQNPRRSSISMIRPRTSSIVSLSNFEDLVHLKAKSKRHQLQLSDDDCEEQTRDQLKLWYKNNSTSKLPHIVVSYKKGVLSNGLLNGRTHH